MTWGAKLNFALIVEAPYVNPATALSSGIFVDHVSLSEAATALRLREYSVVVVNPVGHDRQAAELAEVIYMLNPHARLVWTSRDHDFQPPVAAGEVVAAANGRQLLRHLAAALAQAPAPNHHSA